MKQSSKYMSNLLSGSWFYDTSNFNGMIISIIQMLHVGCRGVIIVYLDILFFSWKCSQVSKDEGLKLYKINFG